MMHDWATFENVNKANLFCDVCHRDDKLKRLSWLAFAYPSCLYLCIYETRCERKLH